MRGAISGASTGRAAAAYVSTAGRCCEPDGCSPLGVRWQRAALRRSRRASVRAAARPSGRRAACSRHSVTVKGPEERVRGRG